MTDPTMRSITVRVGGQNPPSGVVVGEGGSEISFTGWLGMIQALSDLLAAPEPAAAHQQEVHS